MAITSASLFARPSPGPAVPDPFNPSTGIPQSSAPPSMIPAFGENPWDVEEREQQAAESEWRFNALQRIDQAALDPDNYFRDSDLSFARSPKEGQRAATVDAFLQFHNNGDPLPPEAGKLNRDLFRLQIAQTEFGGRGASSDDEFYSEIVKSAQFRKDRKALWSDLATQAFQSSLATTAAPERAGEFSWEKFRESARSKPGFRSEDESDLYDAWTAAQSEARAAIAEFSEPLKIAFSDVSEGPGYAFEAYEKMDGPTRRRFVDTLALAARQLSPEQQRGFWGNLATTTKRDAERIGGGTLTGLLFAEPNVYAKSQEERDPEFAKLQRDLRDYRDDIARVRDQSYDPIRPLMGDGFWGAVERGVYGAPGVVMTSAAMAVPYVGQAVTFQMLEESAYTDLRARFIDGGMDYDKASLEAESLAATVGILQYIPERIGLGLVTRRIPSLNRALTAIGDRISNRVIRAGAMAGTIAVGENITEQIQDFTPAAVVDIASALSSDIPEVNWEKEFEGFAMSNVTTIVATLPLAILGAAGGLDAESRAKAFSEASPRQLAALGFSPDAVENVMKSKALGQASLNQAVTQAWNSRDPNSETAKTAVAELEAEALYAKQATETLESFGVLPRSVRNPDGGWTIYDTETGQQIATAPTAESAARIATTHANFNEEQDADRIAFVASIYQAAEQSGNWSEASGRKTETELDLGTALTAEEFATQSESARLQAEAQERVAGGNGELSRVVFGQSRTDTSNGIRRTVNRILEGGSVLTVFHEEAHGFRREAHARGLLTREDDLTILRAVDSVLMGRTREGERRSLLPENFDSLSPADQDTAIDEGISELMEAEIIRTRKGTGVRKLPPGLISRNLSALARIAGDQTIGKFRSFIRAVREFFGLALDRAHHIQRGLADGTIDRAEYDSYLNKLLGIDEQVEFEQQARDAEAAILDGVLEESEIEDDAPFSLSRRGVKLSKAVEQKVENAAFEKAKATRIVNTDEVRPMIPGYAEADPFTRDVTFHAIARDINKRVLDRMLSEPSETGRILVLAGGGGSGKSTALTKFDPGADFTFDTPLSNPDTVSELIGKAGASGRDVQFVYVHREFGGALKNVISRYLTEKDENGGGRIVPLDVLISAHIGAQETLFTLDPESTVIFDNNGEIEQIHEIALAEIQNSRYVQVDETKGDARGVSSAPRAGVYQSASGGNRGGSSQAGKNPSRNQAEKSLRAEGERILRERHTSGYLTDSELSAFLGDSSADSLSLGPARLAGALRGDAISRIKAPARRIEAMSRISRNLESLRLQAERLELLSGTKRLRRSLMKEAAMREAKRAEELEGEAYARHWGILSDDDLTRIKEQPAHAHLADPTTPLRGRLMSKTRAIEKHPDMFQLHRPGDYDGSDGVSRSVFGGQLMPDQAAQELYTAGIIKEPTTDALWEILIKEQSMVSSMKEARQKALDDIRAAKQQARRETNEWLASQVESQEANFSPKQEIVRSLAMLDAILNVLPPEVRGKIGGYTQLARIGSDELRLAFLKERLASVDGEIEKWLRIQYNREMEALLKRARPEKDESGKKPRGKIGADVHALFRSIEQAMGLSEIEAEAEAVRIETLATDEGVTPDQLSHAMLEANLIRLVANWHHADSARRESAIAEATRVFETGYETNRAEMSAKSERRSKQRDALRASTGKAGEREERIQRARKDAKKLNRTLQSVLSLASFEQVVHHAFGEQTPEADLLVEWERRASNAREDSVQNKVDAIEQLFSDLAGGKFKGEQLRHKLAEPGTVKVTTSRGDQTFSELEAIAATLMWRQEDGRRHMEGAIDDDGKAVGEWHWTQADLDTIEDQLSPSAKAVRLHLGEAYASEYARLNPVFRGLYGVDLPRHKNYSPLTVKPAQSQAGQILDPVTGAGMSGATLTPGSLRNRMQTGVAEPDFRDALQTYLAHVRQMEHFIAYAPFTTEAMSLINTRAVGNSVEAAAGKETLNILRAWLDYFAQGGNRDAAAHLGFNQALNRATGRIAVAALAGRASVLVIQSLQLGAGLAQMPTGAFLARFGKLMTGQLGWGSAMKSDFIQRRKNQMPPLVRQALDGLLASKPNLLKYWMARVGELIGGADALFTAGTFAIIHDYQLAQAKAAGLTGAKAETHATEAAERITERVAQPTRAGARSLYEVTSTHPAAKILWAFASEPRQKLALVGYEFSKKSAPIGAKARALAVTWLIGGAGAALIRAATRDVRNDDDDELFDERNWDVSRLALSALSGPLQGIPILGDVIEGGIYKAAGEYLPEGNLFSVGERAITATGKIPDWFTGDREWEDILGDIEGILGGVAPFSDTAAATSSASHVVTDAAKILDNLFGD